MADIDLFQLQGLGGILYILLSRYINNKDSQIKEVTKKLDELDSKVKDQDVKIQKNTIEIVKIETKLDLI